MLTSSNYDDNQKKVTGGRNGYGAKLANIFSTKFVIHTADSSNSKIYKQVFTKNMSKKEDPVITQNFKKEDYTCIEFYPDLEKFKMEKLDDDIVNLFTKRAYDLAGVVNTKVKVWLNNKKINIKDFDEYATLYLDNEENKELPRISENKTDRW